MPKDYQRHFRKCRNLSNVRYSLTRHPQHISNCFHWLIKKEKSARKITHPIENQKNRLADCPLCSANARRFTFQNFSRITYSCSFHNATYKLAGRNIRIASSFKGAVPCGFFLCLYVRLTLSLAKFKLPQA